MKRSSQPVLLLLVLALAAAAHAASTGAVVKGVVRDTHGAPQMGALVQILAPDATAIATAITDLRGRYRIYGIAPGRYQMRASAALFMPVLRQNLRLGAGVQATVNLTLSALYDATGWLPAHRRAPDAPSDDWRWTLRSAENRPVLRVLDDGSVVFGSEIRRHSIEHGAALTAGGGFGQGGVHSVVTMDRSDGDGSAAVLRADLGVPHAGGSLESSFGVGAGYERSLGLAGSARMVTFYQNHPELQMGGVTGPRSGVQSLEVLSAQRMQFGDSVAVEVGSLLRAVRSGGASETAFAAQPFLNVTVQPAPGLLVAYGMATARELQNISDMDSLRGEAPVAVLSGGQLRMEQGRHQQISITKKTGQGKVQATIYADDLTQPMLSGVGAPDAGAEGILADSSTGTFRILGPSYRERGVSVAVAEPITRYFWLSGEYTTGDALVPSGTEGSVDVAPGQLRSQWAQAGMIALEGNLLNSGTNMRMSYRWQPGSAVTAVNAYDAASDRAYLNLYLRQPLRCRLLPDGFEAVVDVSNLLAQGYRPVAVSADGGTLYLAQTARTVQGGLAFTF